MINKKTATGSRMIRSTGILVLLIIISLSLLVQMSPQENKSDKEMAQLQRKWLGIESWQANYSETFTSKKTWEIRPGITIVTEVHNIGGGHYVLNEKQGGVGNYTEWYGYGSGHYSSTTTVTLKAMVDGTQITVTEITRSIGSGKIGNRSDEKYGASLDIDALTGTYGAGFDFPNTEKTTLTRRVDGIPTSYEGVSKLPQGLREIFLPLAMRAEDWATYDGDINGTSPMVGGIAGIPLFGDMDEPKEYELPKSGLSLKGTYTGKYMSKTWSLRPGGKGKELVLAKCDPDWLPEEKNSIKIAVKGDGWYGEEVKIRFTLFEVTSEPGTCMNSKDESKEPDLDFYHPDNSESKFSSIERTEDGFVVETAKPEKNITINVASRDFGAWGKLKAEAGYEGLWQPVLTEDGKDHIIIPVDESGGKANHIADRFEKDMALDAGVDPKLDEEGPEKRGDGLSAYEEYRGFFIGRGNPHHRTNPKEPDLFIYPDTRRLGQYLREIQDRFPANVKVHLIQEDQAKYHMAINPNNNLHNLVIQHGLWIVERNIENPGVVGRMYGSFGSPKTCFYVAVDFPEFKAVGLNKKKYFFNTIVHELFHGLNVRHHGPSHRPVLEYGETVHLDHDVGLNLPVAAYNGVCSGDVGCVMSYGSACYYEESPGRLALNDFGWPRFFVETNDRKIYSHLCSEKTGTGAGENFQLGPAKVGICIKAVQIADK